MPGEPTKPKSRGRSFASAKGRVRQNRFAARDKIVGFGRHRRLRRQGPRDVAACRRRQGPAGVRARCHHEPAADLGYGLCAAGRHVSRGGVAGQSRYPPRLLSRPQRVPRLGVDFRQRATGEADEQDRLPRRQHPDRQGACRKPAARLSPPPCAPWCSSATPWRRRSTSSASRPANSGCSKYRCSCFRKAMTIPLSRRSARSRA